MIDKLRILLVEDSDDDALLVLHQVRNNGYDIEFKRVENAEEMKKALKQNTWDLVLSDYVMPHFNGLQALSVLQKSEIDIPFIIISGTIGEDVAVEAMKAGAHDYIMKNNRQRLLPAIERELREAKNRAQQRLLEQKQRAAEEEQLEHLWFFKCMDRINHAMLGTNNLDQMMNDVLNMALSIFDCERTWLIYPCDPDAPSFLVSMEVTQPEYPCPKMLDIEIAMSPEEAMNFREALESNAPVTNIAGTDRPITADKQFGIQSQMFMAIYPKSEKPWLFGIHQCSSPRIWTSAEKKLFHEIGRRTGDALTGLLMYRDLCKSEEENRAIINAVPDLLFRVDRNGIITDYRKPENLELYSSPDHFLGKPFVDVLPANVSLMAVAAIEKALSTNEVATFEYNLEMTEQCKYYEGRVVAISKDDALTVVRDITNRKRTEIEISRVNRALKMLSETNSALIRINHEVTLLNEVCKIIVDVGKYRLTWVGFVEHDEAKTLRPVAHAGFGSEYVKSAKVSWADDERGHGPGGTAIRTGQPCIIRNITSDLCFAPWRDAAIKHGYNSIIALPIISEEKTYGAIGIYSVETDAFDAMEVEILLELTNDLAYGISAIHAREERKKAELEVLQSEKRFKELANLLPQSIFEADKDGNITFANEAALIAFGYSPDDISVGLNMLNMVPEKDRAESFKTIQQISQSMFHVKKEYVMLRKDGTTFPALTFTAPIIQNGRITGLRGAITDISELIQAKREVENERTLLKTLIDNLPSSVFVKDKNYRKIIANNIHICSTIAHLSTLGIKSETEIIGKTDFEVTTKELAEKYFQDDQKVIRDGYVQINKEEEGVGPDGRPIWMLVSKIPLINDDGSINGMVGITTDITELKLAEEELNRKTTEIERQNNEYALLNQKYLVINEELTASNEKLKIALEKAKESDQLKTAFLQNMSHEIRTPMNSILGFAELLNDPDLSTEDQGKYLQIIDQSGHRMLNIINDIIDISKIEAGQVTMQIEKVHLNQLLKDLHIFFMPETKNKNLIISFHCGHPDEESTIKTEKSKLLQVLTNLIKNSLKFTYKGQIDFGYVRKDELLEFFVHDTGIGIDSSQKEIIFERFRQGNVSPTRTYEGAGLGLSISKSFIELLGGKIWVESEIGKGSTFYFTLPCKIL